MKAPTARTYDIEGRRLVVTGAAGGLGSAIVEAALDRGAHVVAWTRRSPDVAWLRHPAVRHELVDVTDERSIQAAAARLDGPPDALVNCAGIAEGGPLLDLPVESWRRVIDVNLTGTFLCARSIATLMTPTGGAIVNVGSIVGMAPAPKAGAYSSSKAGMIRLTEQMALEWAPHGIRVNCVAPGTLDSGLSIKTPTSPQTRRLREARIPARRIGVAEDVVGIVLFLTSVASRMVTGATVVVDGGLTLAGPTVDLAQTGVGR